MEENETTFEETNEPTEQSQDDTSELTVEELREQLDEERARREKAESVIEKRKKAEKVEKVKSEVKSESVADDALLARFESRGVMDKEDQEYLIRAAKIEGKHPIEMLNDDYVKAQIEQRQKARKVNGSTPKVNNRTTSGQTKLDQAIVKYKETGEVPENPKLAAQLLKKLRNK